MFASINAAGLRGLPVAEQIDAVAQAGFRGIELFIAADGALRSDTPAGEFREIREIADARQVQVIGLASGMWFQGHFASREPAGRAAAHDLALKLMDQAAAIGPGTSVLVIPAVVGRPGDARPQCSYAEALNLTYEALSTLRFEAEQRDVVLVIETAWTRFLLSPVEAAALIDRVNSPAVGVCVDVANVLSYGYPEDWLRTLGRRVLRVHVRDYDLAKSGKAGFCMPRAGSVDWDAVVRALHEIGYAGPLTYEGDGELSEARRRLEGLLTPRSGA